MCIAPFCRTGARVQRCSVIQGLNVSLFRAVTVYACWLRIMITRVIFHFQKGLPIWAIDYQVTIHKYVIF